MVTFLWNTLLVVLLINCLLIVIIGSLGVLKVTIQWSLKQDYTDELRKVIKDVKHNRSE